MTRCYGCRDPLASTDLTTRISKPSREIVFCWRCAEEKIFHQFCIESVKQHRAAKKVRNQEIVEEEVRSQKSGVRTRERGIQTRH